MQNTSIIEKLILERNLTKKYVYTHLGYSASGFDKAIKHKSFKSDSLVKLAKTPRTQH